MPSLVAINLQTGAQSGS